MTRFHSMTAILTTIFVGLDIALSIPFTKAVTDMRAIKAPNNCQTSLHEHPKDRLPYCSVNDGATVKIREDRVHAYLKAMRRMGYTPTVTFTEVTYNKSATRARKALTMQALTISKVFVGGGILVQKGRVRRYVANRHVTEYTAEFILLQKTTE